MSKGKLLIIGGAEDKGGDSDGRPAIRDKNRDFNGLEILRLLLPDDNDGDYRIEIITTATEEPRAMRDEYYEAFDQLGFRSVDHINIRTKDEAHGESYLERIDRAHAVLFTGGDQLRLSTILGGTEFLDTILRRYREEKDFVVAGTSAGAMAIAKLMIYDGVVEEAPLVGDMKLTSGFGFIDGCIIDTHFVKRSSFGRLAQAIVMNPGCIGIGLGEDTALLIKQGFRAECFGSGSVTIIDGQDIGHSNIAYARNETPVCVENLRVHLLAKGDGFSIRDRRFIVSKEDQERENEIR